MSQSQKNDEGSISHPLACYTQSKQIAHNQGLAELIIDESHHRYRVELTSAHYQLQMDMRIDLDDEPSAKALYDLAEHIVDFDQQFDESADDDNDEEEDNTELAIQVSKENQTLLELAIHTNFGLTVDHLIPETETDTVLVYFIDEEKDKEFRQGLLGYLEERERRKFLTIRQDRALRYNVE